MRAAIMHARCAATRLRFMKINPAMSKMVAVPFRTAFKGASAEYDIEGTIDHRRAKATREGGFNQGALAAGRFLTLKFHAGRRKTSSACRKFPALGLRSGDLRRRRRT